MKFPLSLLTAGLLALSAAAQTPQPPAPPTDPLPPLIQQREQLIREYEAANAQRNAFLANKPSKKDLQEVIDALKGIIRKDTEIVQALKESSLRRTATIVAEKQQAEQQATVATTDQTSTRQRFYDLENQIQNLQLRDQQREKKLREALATAEEAEAGRTTPQLLATALALLSAGLLWVIFRQRQRLGAAPARRRR
ncbi:hypothetical protein F0P96_19060 [Hymenobacter busanensis]|uniref:Uncharacterized protein n=1 Tax=Hymenobacter busanensis TaxID=2607656 RepID=A0A7L4ZSJ5_9BACT|nr:hypothetical protein [Hymenobacter busanensis]KAA9325866.1 hypothetical protein F0P96_19060 [Hymenobacter busanensis]QHJ06294.1 hypothetical protein GUY19_02865 [Hymenobacter busanensis]